MDLSLRTSLIRIALFYAGLFVFYELCHGIDKIQAALKRRRSKRA